MRRVIVQDWLMLIIMVIVVLTNATIPVEAAPGTASGPAGVASQPENLGGADLGGAAPAAVRSAAPAAKTTTAPDLVATAEANKLQDAVDAWNKKNPREPIKEINQWAIDVLMKYQLIDKPPTNLNDFVMVDGRVFQKVNQKPPDDPPVVPIPTRKPNSFIEVAQEQITQPIDPGLKQIDPNRNDLPPAFEIVEKTIPIRLLGSTIYVPVRIPRIRNQQVRRFPITAPQVRPCPFTDRLEVIETTTTGRKKVTDLAASGTMAQ